MTRAPRKLTKLQRLGAPSHINAKEDRLLRQHMPDAHGVVIRKGLLAEAGRGRDDRVTKLIPAEADLLKLHGGSGAINPRTGMREYDDSDNDGGNTSSAGENTGGMDSSNSNSGVTGNEGPSSSNGGNSGGYGGNGYSDDAMASIAGQVGYGFTPGYSPVGPSLSQIGPNPGNWSGRSDDLGIVGGWHLGDLGPTLSGYKERGTWGRLAQELFTPSTPYSPYAAQMPGRWGAPNAIGPGVVGQAITSLIGGPFGPAMSVGAAMGRAGGTSHGADTANSGGNDTTDDFGSARPGGATNTGLLGDQKPGEGRSEVPAMDVNKGTLPGVGSLTHDNTNSTPGVVPQLIQNSLSDYVWRGRNGLGFGSW